MMDALTTLPRHSPVVVDLLWRVLCFVAARYTAVIASSCACSNGVKQGIPRDSRMPPPRAERPSKSRSGLFRSFRRHQTTWRVWPARTIPSLCTVLDTLQQREADREHLQAAIAICEGLEAGSPDTLASVSRELGTTDQGLAAYRRGFASAYCCFGDWLAKDGDREKAAAAFRKGLATYERLVTDFPSVPYYRRNLAANLSKWSTFLEASGDKVGAEAAARRAIGARSAR